jgi:hypothetical protein
MMQFASLTRSLLATAANHLLFDTDEFIRLLEKTLCWMLKKKEAGAKDSQASYSRNWHVV